MKKYLFFMIFTVILFGQTNYQNNKKLYSNMEKSYNINSINKFKAKFSNLALSKEKIKKEIAPFQHLQTNIENNFFNFLEKKVKNANMVSNSKYLSKKEFDKMKKQSLSELNTIKKIKKDGFNFLFFFTSSSVPNKVISNWMLEIAILEKANVNILPIVYIRGFGDHFKKYFFNLAHTMDKNIPKTYKPYVKNSFRLKLGSQFFKYLKLKRVPAVVLAHCTNLSPLVKDCKIKYLMKGDMHLDYFFYKIMQKNKNPKYKKYYRILIANGIVNYKNKKVKIRGKYEKYEKQ